MSAQEAYERYVAARLGVEIDGSHLRAWNDLDEATRDVWRAVADPSAPRQLCHGSLLPPVGAVLHIIQAGDAKVA